MRCELVVFDWDGTLADSTGRIVESMQAAFVAVGLPRPDEDAVRGIIGLNLHVAIAKLSGHISPRRQQSIADSYRGMYALAAAPTRLFDGAVETLRTISERGSMLAVATGKSRAGLNRALAEQGLESYFSFTKCADECRSKPDPQMLHEIMGEAGVAPEQTVMVGDTTHDLLMARNAGVRAAGVTYGAHARGALSALAPEFLLDRIDELPDLLAGRVQGG
ncbi:MAG: HAD-IA family hydrolase [Gammaproteobacteria bacterium]|nr:HAD-IA family hydrolase [Gammaproteobacteria bacterium]